jgi:predicted DNA binding CopG/RHH family protein
MKKKIIYTDEPLAMGEKLDDFLPPPAELVKRETTVKIALEISQSSLAFFKEQAKNEHVSYQRMLQNLIDAYAKQQIAHIE